MKVNQKVLILGIAILISIFLFIKTSYSVNGSDIINITLIFPENATALPQTMVSFEANITSYGNYNLTNATLYVWSPDSTLFDTNFTSFSGETKYEEVNLTLQICLGTYKWNYYACADNRTDTICNFGNDNYTLYISKTNITDSSPKTGDFLKPINTTFYIIFNASNIYKVEIVYDYDNTFLSSFGAGYNKIMDCTKIYNNTYRCETNISVSYLENYKYLNYYFDIYYNSTDFYKSQLFSTRVDNDTPIVTLIYPENYSYYNGNLFKFNASDDSFYNTFKYINGQCYGCNILVPLLYCDLYIDNNLTNSTIVSNISETQTITTDMKLSGDTHFWYINCTDKAGWSGISETFTFFSNLPPNIISNKTYYYQDGIAENVTYGYSYIIVVDLNDTENDDITVNFTVISPNGTVIINGTGITILNNTYSNPEEGCIYTGGYVYEGTCCGRSSDFPSVCAPGACVCYPPFGPTIKMCNCVDRRCFNGKRCVDKDLYGQPIEYESEIWRSTMFTIENKTINLGIWNWTILACDNNSNCVTINGYYNITDETPPRVEITSPGKDTVPSNKVTCEEIINIEFIAVDDVELDTCKIVINYNDKITGTTNIVNETINCSEPYQFNCPKCTTYDNNYTVYLTVNDTSGNTNSTEKFFYVVYTTEPIGPGPVITKPTENSTDANGDGDYWDSEDDYDGDGIPNKDDDDPWNIVEENKNDIPENLGGGGGTIPIGKYAPAYECTALAGAINFKVYNDFGAGGYTLYMLPGKSVTKNFYVENNGTQNVALLLSLYSNDTSHTWMNLSDKYIEVTIGTKEKFSVTFNVPENVTAGEYHPVILFIDSESQCKLGVLPNVLIVGGFWSLVAYAILKAPWEEITLFGFSFYKIWLMLGILFIVFSICIYLNMKYKKFKALYTVLILLLTYGILTWVMLYI
ncbi:MAG: hypothetical protein DRP74_07515 [Candidatus Omnitrophota bacterium]|nr:MAG: hypothetical protein DRP74_07515 [Candidatus Omnitrophota bacterium]